MQSHPEQNLSNDHPLTLLLLRLLEHLLDNLLLLNQEGSHNAVPDAVSASRSTICTLNSLLWPGDLGVLAGSEGGDLLKYRVSICDTMRFVDQPESSKIGGRRFNHGSYARWMHRRERRSPQPA